MSKDTFYSIVPINWLLKLTALSNVYRKDKHLTTCESLIKSISYIVGFGLFNLCYMYFKFKQFKGNRQTGLVRFSDSVQSSYWITYFEYAIDVLFVFKYSRISLINYFEMFNQIDETLGMPFHDEIRGINLSTTAGSLAIFIFNSLFDYTSWFLMEGWQDATIYSIDYFYVFLNTLTVLDIISHVIQVEYRLKVICDLLQDRNTLNTKKPVIEVKTRTNTKDNVSKPLDSLNTLCSTKYLESAWFSRCYLVLLDQVAYVNTSYGFRVMMFCVNLLINIINLLNLALRIVNGTIHPTYANGYLTYLPSASSTMKAANYALMAMILIYRCEQAYKQTDRILETIDTLLASKKYCDNLKTDLTEFRNILITRPIKFHAVKFFVMDYTLLVSLSSVIVTYTIIILQNVQ